MIVSAMMRTGGERPACARSSSGSPLRQPSVTRPVHLPTTLMALLLDFFGSNYEYMTCRQVTVQHIPEAPRQIGPINS